MFQTISIPGSKEDRKFNFKTSQGDIDGLECVHQAIDSSRQPQVSEYVYIPVRNRETRPIIRTPLLERIKVS